MVFADEPCGSLYSGRADTLQRGERTFFQAGYAGRRRNMVRINALPGPWLAGKYRPCRYSILLGCLESHYALPLFARPKLRRLLPKFDMSRFSTLTTTATHIIHGSTNRNRSRYSARLWLAACRKFASQRSLSATQGVLNTDLCTIVQGPTPPFFGSGLVVRFHGADALAGWSTSITSATATFNADNMVSSAENLLARGRFHAANFL